MPFSRRTQRAMMHCATWTAPSPTCFRIEAMGIGKNEMEVKLLGGADVLDHGLRNPWTEKHETALEIMKQENLNLAVSDVGGRMGERYISTPIRAGAFQTDKEDTP